MARVEGADRSTQLPLIVEELAKFRRAPSRVSTEQLRSSVQVTRAQRAEHGRRPMHLDELREAEERPPVAPRRPGSGARAAWRLRRCRVAEQLRA